MEASEDFSSRPRRAIVSSVIVVGPRLGVECQQPNPATNHRGDRHLSDDQILHHAQGHDQQQ
jgi:hypothetical protein